MTSLREEIENIVHEDVTPTCDGCSDKALKIISVIEKRIDAMIIPIDKLQIFTLHDEGWNKALRELKEMLK